MLITNASFGQSNATDGTFIRVIVVSPYIEWVELLVVPFEDFSIVFHIWSGCGFKLGAS